MLKPGLAAIALLSCAATAHASSPVQIRVLERGVYHAETVGQAQVPGASHRFNTVQNARLISSTTRVHGKVGVRFGLRYVARQDDSNMPTELTLVIIFPPGGLRDPSTGQTYLESKHTLQVRPGTALYWEYHFENPWELALGVWTFEFWHDGQKLARQDFCVIDPNRFVPSARMPIECRLGIARRPFPTPQEDTTAHRPAPVTSAPA